jgi:acylpyruvate hydrolase
MKLVTFRKSNQTEREASIGILQDDHFVLDLEAAAALYLREEEREEDSSRLAAKLIPHEMCRFLEQGSSALELARKTIEFIVPWQKGKKIDLKNEQGRGVMFPLEEVTLRAPVPRPGKLMAMGLNFYDHAAENKVPPPEFPVGFLKAATSLVGPGEPVPYPQSTRQLDYEIEMAIVIGKRGRDIPAEKAFEYVAGYTILNDLSARDIQSREMSKRLVLLSKSLDGLGPMGPWLVTKDEVPDPNNLAMELYVNDEPEPRQKSNTSQMVFKIPDLIAYWSQMTLEPGDIISSGTPGGVAFFRQPPEKWLLKVGDVVEARIEKLGILKNQIVG